MNPKIKEKSSLFNCPYNCNKTYKKSGRFIGHLILKHDKSWKCLFVILGLLGIALAIVSPLYSDYVQYGWDKILGKDINFYLSVNSIYSFKNEKPINITNQNEEGLKFLNQQVLLGLIPPNHNNKAPITWNLEDSKNGMRGCLFWSYNNINKFIPPKDLDSELKEMYPEGAKELGMITPTREIIKKLEKCDSCLGQLFYGVNLGARNINTVNFEVCYKEEYFVEDTDFEQNGDHCFRAKKENLIENETFLVMF